MVTLTTIQQVELFHLAFLRVLETKLDRTRYVVTGGVNLRAWFGSPRYSEALDIDSVLGTRDALESAVDKALESPALSTLLAAHEIEIARVTKPKQTETTQRWKVQIEGARAQVALPTKIEFSRRRDDDEHVLEPVRSAIVRPYGLPAPTANHYTAAAACRQKIRALAGRREPQARDVWDLDHLLRVHHADPRPLPAPLLAAVGPAIERVLDLPFDAFRSQVLPYLAPDDQALYGDAVAWDRIQDLVIERLDELQRS